MFSIRRYHSFERIKFSVELWRLSCGCRELQVHLGILELKFSWSNCYTERYK